MILPSSTLKVSGLSLAFQPVRSFPLKSGVKPSSFAWEKAQSRVAMSRCFTDRSPLYLGPYGTTLGARSAAFAGHFEDADLLELHDPVAAAQAGETDVAERPAGIGRGRRGVGRQAVDPPRRHARGEAVLPDPEGRDVDGAVLESARREPGQGVAVPGEQDGQFSRAFAPHEGDAEVVFLRQPPRDLEPRAGGGAGNRGALVERPGPGGRVLRGVDEFQQLGRLV